MIEVYQRPEKVHRSRESGAICEFCWFLLNWKSCTLKGEVSERFKEHAWKACVGEILPWVRIPPSPPLPLFSCIYKAWCLSWCLLCTDFRPTIGGKEACGHVQTRQRLRH